MVNQIGTFYFPTRTGLSYTPTMPDPVPFTPVPRKCRRRDGWTEERQHGFIAALAEGLDPEKAAQSQGLTGNGAYQLRKAAGAESFAAAWDAAVARGRAPRPPAAPAAAQSSGQATDDDPLAEIEAIDTLIAQYGRKLSQERKCRIEGRIVEADFYCRQLSWIEVVLCLSDGCGKLLDGLHGGDFGPLDIAATALSNHLEQVRRAIWREKGEPDRPPPSLVARLAGAHGGIGVGHEVALPGGADWKERLARRRQRESLQAEAQRQWEARARADAEAWAADERAATAAEGATPENPAPEPRAVRRRGGR